MTTHSEKPAATGLPISAIVPVREFAHGFKSFLDAWRRTLGQDNRTFELIVIDDGSADETASIAREVAERAPGVRVVRHESPRGLGAALRSGIDVSQHPLILILVPDYAYRPTDLRPLVDGLTGADIAAGVRIGQSRPRWWEKLNGIGRGIAKYIFGVEFDPPAAWYGWAHFRRRLRLRMRYGLRLQDPACGLKLFRREVIERCPIQSDGAFALIESMAKANFAGALLCEVPLTRAGDIPVMRGQFEEKPGDERGVFKRPVFSQPRAAGLVPAG